MYFDELILFAMFILTHWIRQSDVTMEMDWPRIVGVAVGFIIAIPVFFLRLITRFISLGCKIFHVKERNIPPDCLVDPKFGAHKFMTVNGVKLHYVESGDTSKPLLVFVHGWPQFWYSWRYQILHFQSQYHMIWGATISQGTLQGWITTL